MIVVVGDLVTDVLVVHTGPIAIGSDTGASITVSGGGQAANTAAWLARAGRDVTLVAAVGDDPAGRERVAELTAAGVRCAVRTQEGASTGSVVVLAGPQERTMITDRGAALLLGADDVRAALETPAAHLHLSGYPLLHAESRPAGLAALRTAAGSGLTTSVDAASAAPLRSVGAGAFLAWVRDTDVLLCNADEADVLAGPGTAEEQARRLTEHARNAVVKRGAAGATWASRDGRLWSVAPEQVREMKDPTGAGDAFAAGLLAAWCAGADPEAALRAGSQLGAEAVGQVGARPRHPFSG
ncbi:ribokinase [Paractinoplanes deccanensis]|uniref:Ribokinase n=1 Tax=Paractinoplanes deccanensis TaxID=113561 RepID=A0ABQ3XW10_9ACTN|nr:ribokinase [Actinoplanes deccanensis]